MTRGGTRPLAAVTFGDVVRVGEFRALWIALAQSEVGISWPGWRCLCWCSMSR